MAESNLAESFSTIQLQVADFLGLQRGSSNWSTNDKDRIDEVMRDGLNQFLYPPPIPGFPPAYRWRFLHVAGTLTLAIGTESYSLPDDFGTLTSGFKFTDNRCTYHPRVVPKDYYDRYRDADTTSNTRPVICLIEPQAVSGTTVGQRFKISFWPKPDATYAMRYGYSALPNKISGTLEYPHGGAAHANTILYSCLACAELRMNGGPGPMRAMFMERLAASIQIDLANSAYDTIGMMTDPSVSPGLDEETWISSILANHIVS